jgi:four helix bundle protein
MEVQTHRDLLAWKEAMALVESVYRVTRTFPRDELFGLTSQVRRCAVSIPSNIAEGAARNSSREFLQHLGIACGSVAELDTQLAISIRLGYLRSGAPAVKQLQRVKVLTIQLRRSVRSRVQRS